MFLFLTTFVFLFFVTCISVLHFYAGSGDNPTYWPVASNHWDCFISFCCGPALWTWRVVANWQPKSFFAGMALTSLGKDSDATIFVWEEKNGQEGLILALPYYIGRAKEPSMFLFLLNEEAKNSRIQKKTTQVQHHQYVPESLHWKKDMLEKKRWCQLNPKALRPWWCELTPFGRSR